MAKISINRHHNGKPPTRSGLGNVQITIGDVPKSWPKTMYQRQFVDRGRLFMKIVRDPRPGYRKMNRMKQGKDKGKFRIANTVAMADRGFCKSDMMFDTNDFSVLVEIKGSTVPGMV